MLWISQNFSSFLCLSPPLVCCFFLSLPLHCSIALLCSVRIVEGWSYLLAGSVCLRSAGKANAPPDMHRQYCGVVLWPEKPDHVSFLLVKGLVFRRAGLSLVAWESFFICKIQRMLYLLLVVAKQFALIWFLSCFKFPRMCSKQVHSNMKFTKGWSWWKLIYNV